MSEGKKYSPSSTNQFFTCPYQWKLTRIDGVDSATIGNKNVLGENIHCIIKKYYDTVTSKPTVDFIKTIAHACFKTYFLESELKEHKEVAAEMIENFIKFEIARLPNYTSPIFTEKRLEDDTFSGIIDFFDGQKIIDWKTGNMLSLSEKEKRQGAIYQRLLKSAGYEGNFKVFFVTLKNNRSLEMPLVTETWLMGQVQRMHSIIESGKFPKIKSGLCYGYCPAQIACEYDGEKLWEGIPKW